MRQSGSGSSSRILFELFMIEDIEMVECSSFRDQTTLGNIDILDGSCTCAGQIKRRLKVTVTSFTWNVVVNEQDLVRGPMFVGFNHRLSHKWTATSAVSSSCDLPNR